ncbi:MAG: acyl-CoA dehydrogenase [Hyphomicrobiales bacterium]|nr:acyl-CoA dehydrogenase [Hyphomicrobiales bacterium]
MPYRAPVKDMMFMMNAAAGLDAGMSDGIYADLADGMAEATLNEAAKFAENVIGPLNRGGDQIGAKWKDGVVTTAPGWIDAYRQFVEGGWQSVTGSPDHGGMGLPQVLLAGCMDMWSAANMAFMLGPVLTFGAIDALEAHASDEIKHTYLEKMVSGVWPATMNLTEPGAGSDLNPLRTRAERQGDGTYRIFGQKIFITYGEHDMSENIVHLVLARLPDAPAGTRGISLFVVPKFMVNADGSLGDRNDVRCAGVEHKLGIHGSPTCIMVYGDNGGAVGYLVGEENKGLACMFTMMNDARLATGLQGVAIGEASYQHALAYANERKQGRAADAKAPGLSPIIEHPDVKRMLMTMKAMTQSARAVCYATAGAIDRSRRAKTPEERKAASERAGLLTPIAKAYSSDIGCEVASIGVQVHGGMGFVEETGAAQFMRDSRIVPIYEGTNGIQAIDLVTRKLPTNGGAVMKAEIADMRSVVEALRGANDPAFGATAARLGDALDAFERATSFMLGKVGSAVQDALAGATPYLRMFGLVRGGATLGAMALAAHRARGAGDSDPAHAARIATARFFAENVVVAAGGLETTIVGAADSVLTADLALAG